MTFKLTSALLVVSVTLFIYCGQAEAVSSADIKKKITKTNSWEYIGIGGRYGRLSDTCSKANIIESDHFPPKSAYSYAKDKNIKNIAERDMAAVTISYDEHRKLLTTGNANVAGGFMNQWLADHFKAGQYYEAIVKNIQIYEESGFLPQIKKGVQDALLVHVANKLITDAQRKALIKQFSLDNYDKKIEADADRQEAIKVIRG